MDSWIYGALDRLASLGYIPSQMTSLRPWTRAECLRQTREAQSRIPVPGAATPAIDSQATSRATALPTEAEDFVTALQKEFANDSEAPAIVLQSVRIPLARIVDLAAELTTDLLVVEFVAPQDSMFVRLARGREELHMDLTTAAFEAGFRSRFDIARVEHLGALFDGSTPSANGIISGI
jgi:hypothetical protein